MPIHQLRALVFAIMFAGQVIAAAIVGSVLLGVGGCGLGIAAVLELVVQP